MRRLLRTRILLGYSLMMLVGLLGGAAFGSSHCDGLYCPWNVYGCTKLNRSTRMLCCLVVDLSGAKDCCACTRDLYQCPGLTFAYGQPYNCVEQYTGCQ